MPLSALMGAILTGAATSAAGATASAAAQGIINSRSARRSYKYSKKLLAVQQNYARQNFEMENARQDYLMNNAAAITRNSLANAGYSEANPNAEAVQTASNNSVAAPQASQFAYPENRMGLISPMETAQMLNIIADTRKKEAEARYQEVVTHLKEIYGEQEITAALGKMNEDARKAHEEALYIDQQRLNSIQLTDAQIDEINSRIDISYQKLSPELKLLAAQTFQAEEQGKLNKANQSVAWQSIKESIKRCELMQSEIGLNNAQVDVAVNTAKKIAQETKTEGWKTVFEMNNAQMKQFEQNVQEELGVNAAMAGKIANTILPIGAIFGLLGKLLK